MERVEKRTFLQSGRKEVVHFNAPPQLFASEQDAINH
jgi:hypothetical protein